MLDFPLDVFAVIVTVPDFFAIISPVELTVAMFSSLDCHVIFLSVVSLGVIVAVTVLLFPTSKSTMFSFICIPVAFIVFGTSVFVAVVSL